MTGYHRLNRLILAILLFAVLLIAWLIPSSVCESDASVCIFRTLTGKPCLFCGLTRAFVSVTHGNLDKAFIYHPLWWLAASIVICFGSISLFDAITGTNLLSFLGWLRRIPIWLLVGILVVLTVLRLATMPLLGSP